MDKVKLKEGIETIMKISSLGNSYLQINAPWDLYKSNLERCKVVMIILASFVRLIAVLSEPFMPSFSAKVYEIMNIDYDDNKKTLLKIFKENKENFTNEFLKLAFEVKEIKNALPLFAPIQYLTKKEKINVLPPPVAN